MNEARTKAQNALKRRPRKFSRKARIAAYVQFMAAHAMLNAAPSIRMTPGIPQPLLKPNSMNPFDTPSSRHDQWHAKVVAAQKAVEEAEKALPVARNPAEQTLAFRELKEKRDALKKALRSPC